MEEVSDQKGGGVRRKYRGQPASFPSPRQGAACWIIAETDQPRFRRQRNISGKFGQGDPE